MKHILFRIPRDVATKQLVLTGEHRSVAAAPFDTPFAVDFEVGPTSLSCRFLYDLAGDEPATMEMINGLKILLGELSGRVMRLESTRSKDLRGLIGEVKEATNAIRHRRQLIAVASPRGQLRHSTPIRQAAHYELLSSAVLPAMDKFIAEKLLPDHRETTSSG